MKFLNVGAAARDCAGSPLEHDHGCLEITNLTHNVRFYKQYLGCVGCPLQLGASVSANTKKELPISTLWPLRWRLTYENDTEICKESTLVVGEYGHYVLNSTSSCQPRMTLEPDAAYLPLLETAVTLLALATAWYLVKAAIRRVRAGRLYARFFAREDNELGTETRVLTTESVPRSPTRSRLRSLDIFRGASVAMMIFVNAGGGGYAAFAHSPWNGLTIADLVFPCFAWAMGASLVLSLNARLRTATTRVVALRQVALRSLLMALMGIILGAREASLDNVRFPGVLQRLAAIYLIVGALECAFMKIHHNIIPGRSLIRDISAGWMQWLATAAIASVQVCVSLLSAAPGCPRGYLGPGGLNLAAYNLTHHNCTGGIAGHIDRTVLGASHLYHGGTFRRLYQSEDAFDPEGLLGVLTAVIVVQAGAHSSRIMLHYNHARARVMRLVGWSLLLGLVGGALCQFSQDGGPIPINKNLWSLSYCLVCSAVAFLVQAALYFAVDLKGKWGGRPLYYAGQNALALYVISELLRRHFPLYWPMRAPTHASLLFTHSTTTLVFLALAIALHRKRVFISL